MDKIYTTAIGAWGDILASLGNMALLQRANIYKFGVIYYGYDANIVPFLQVQPGVDEVIYVAPKSPDEYKEVCLMACCTENVRPKDWMNIIDLKVEGLVIQTHVDNYLQHQSHTCIRHFECLLNYEEEYKQKTLLFQPYSIQSSTEVEHWPHWMEALNWLLDNTDYEIIVTGKSSTVLFDNTAFIFPDLPSHPRLHNMVGKTKSMEEVFAIATECTGIITTNNCLSMWSVISETPAMVIHTSKKFPYFMNWISEYPNTILPFETTMEEFQTEFKKWDDTLPKLWLNL